MSTVKAPQFGVWKDDILWNKNSVGKTIETYDDDIKTLYDAITSAIDKYSDRNAVGIRPKTETLIVEDPKSGRKFEKFKFENHFEWLSYAQWGERIDYFGKGLADLTGLKEQGRVLIYAETQRDWMTAAISSWYHNYSVVTAYATLGAEGAAFAINSTSTSTVVADAKLLKVLVSVQDKCPTLKYIVTLAPCDPETRKQLEAKGIHVASMDELIERGRSSATERSPPKPEDTAVIMFTSGTTGNPKGVVITHRNLVCAIAGVKELFDVVPVNEKDVYAAYLPLAHIMEILAEICNISIGASLGYCTAHTLTDTGVKLAKGQIGDLKVLKPTVVVFAPLVLEKIYNAIMLKFKALTGVKALLRDWGLASGRDNFKKGVVGASWFYNTVLFKKVQAITGGNLRYVLTGSAPLDGSVHQFVQTCLNVPVRQGFGSTETCAASCIQDVEDNSVSRVGPPRLSCAIRLVDWEEGGYKFSDKDDPEIGVPRGEILIGGGLITNGYLVEGDNADPDLVKKNKEEFTEHAGMRWFHTGDIGAVHPDGTLSIIDRKKDLVKLQQGEYVALSKVEGVVKLCELVENAMVHVDTSQSYCTVLVCPMLPALGPFLASKGFDKDDLSEENVNREEVKNAILSQIKAAAKGKLAGFEIPKKVYVVPPEEVWTPENDLLTAAQKLKRKPIIKHHEKQIAALYA